MNTEIQDNEGRSNLEEQLYSELRLLASRPLSGHDVISKSTEVMVLVYGAENFERPLRHRYSRIATVIYDGKTPTDWDGIELAARRAQMLSSNLDQLADEVSQRKDIPPVVCECVAKLRDHVALEMQHITVFESLFESQKFMNDAVSKTQIDLDMRSKVIQDEQKENKAEMLGMRREYIAILGIFAGIILAVNSGVGFSLSGIESAVGQGIYPNIMLPLVLMIVGFVVINTVAILFHFIWRMTQEAKTPKSIIISVLVIDAILVLGISACLTDLFYSTALPLP